jgi:hypothetical protein
LHLLEIHAASLIPAPRSAIIIDDDLDKNQLFVLMSPAA